MSPGQTAKHSSWAYAEEHAEEDPVLELARARAWQLGARPVSPGTASALQLLAAAVGASALVEIGSGAGVSGTALLRGAPSRAVLTTIDADPDHSAAAKEVFRAESVPASRTRMITGRAETVLPRLTAAGYDLVFINAPAEETGHFAAEALRLLRSGGLLLINDALDNDRVPKPAVREDSTQAMRELERRLREDPQLTTALLPTGTGLLAAVKG